MAKAIATHHELQPDDVELILEEKRQTIVRINYLTTNNFMSLSGIFKFIIGFLLAIVLLTGASVAAALYFAAKLTALPERPTFPNEVQTSQTVSKNSKPIANSSVELTPSESPKPKPLEPGAYRAIVTQPIGLILRDSPTQDSNRIGGIAYKEKVVVLEDTPDKQWQRVRIEDSDREGWVKSGNTEKTEN